MRFTGTLTTWNDDRGYGFITPEQGGQQMFAHIKDFPAGTGRPVSGQRLTFEVALQPDGRKRAIALQYPPGPRHHPQRHSTSPAPWTWPRGLALPLFSLVVAATYRRWGLLPWWWAPYLGMSLLTFLAYFADKSAAEEGRWRTSESALHFCSLACGWPGALLGQQVFRHKTSKPSFIATFWTTVALNIAGFVALHAKL